MFCSWMRFRIGMRGLLALLFVLLACVARAETVPTRQDVFSIPFQVSPPDEPGQKPIEVHLYVSADRGGQWKLHSRQHPSVGNFRFRAPQDGEYWFAVRTLDRRGRVQSAPAGRQPELVVRVDTVPPRLELDAQLGTAGEVNVRWTLQDPDLDSASFQLEYQPAAGGQWNAIAVDGPAAPQDLVVTGRVSFWPRTSLRVIHLRARVLDRAGNVAVANQRLDLPRVAAQPAGQTAAKNVSAGGGWQPSTTPRRPAHSPVSVPWAPDHIVAGSPPPTSSGLAAVQNSSTNVGQRISAQPVARTRNGLPRGGEGVGPQHQTLAAPYTSRPAYGVVRSPDSARGDIDQDRPSRSPSPPAARSQITNLRSFEFDYVVDAVGPSGVSQVQLWATRDGGQTWSKWAVDDDLQSPVQVQVDQEGLIGFTVVVENGAGLIGQPPQDGDEADIWVTVDHTPPAVRLTSARYGTGANAGRLEIYWDAADRHLLENPVRLLYSSQSDGPWTTIADQLPNDGRFDWSVGSEIPVQLYLKIEVRDQASNVGDHQLVEPIDTGGLSPRGHIRSIRPASNDR